MRATGRRRLWEEEDYPKAAQVVTKAGDLALIAADAAATAAGRGNV